MTLQQAVSDFVRENSMTKDTLAQSIGVGRTSFFNKLRGKSEFSLKEAYALSREMGCSIDELYEMTIAE